MLSEKYNNSRNTLEESLLDLIEQARQSEEWETLWTSCPLGAFRECVSKWAEESFTMALQSAYANVDGTEIESGDFLSFQYYLTRSPIVRKQLALGGVRLAATLEWVFGDSSSWWADSPMVASRV